jgi:hypothetical protein
MKAIKTPQGYLAIQGDHLWYQDTPNGWVVTSESENYLRNVAAHFKVTAHYEIVTI